MSQVVLASGNVGKIKELQELLSDLSFNLCSQTEFNVPEAEETGLTFIENALIKARNACQHTGLPALSDDSGLCIAALNHQPGIFSARYAGSGATDADRIHKVLSELDAIPDADRSASFYCALVFMQSEKDPCPIVGYGRWKGKILFAPQGNQGFGYDPIFYVPTHDCSAAQLPLATKNKISHRGQAIKQLYAALK